MGDKEFKLEVLRLTLEHASVATLSNPLDAAQRNLEWCLAPIDKPVAQSAKTPARKQLNQDKR